MGEYILKVDDRLTGEARLKAIKEAADKIIVGEKERADEEEKFKSAYELFAKQTGVAVENTTEFVKRLLPHTSPAFRRAFLSGGEDLPTTTAPKRRTRESNAAKLSELTDKEVALIKKAKKRENISPLPAGTKNAGKLIAHRSWASIKGIKV